MANKIKSVLLIDDIQYDNFFNEKLIRINGISDIVIVKENGTEALKFLQNCIEKAEPFPDLIFLDYYLPDHDAPEFLVEYEKFDKKFRQNCKLIILTSSISDIDRIKANSFESVTEFISKPLKTESLLKALKKSLKIFLINV